jgi:hypothetical protein
MLVHFLKSPNGVGRVTRGRAALVRFMLMVMMGGGGGGGPRSRVLSFEGAGFAHDR